METGTEALTDRIDLALGPVSLLRPAGEIEAVLRVDFRTNDLEFHWELMLDIILSINPRIPLLYLDEPDFTVDHCGYWTFVL